MRINFLGLRYLVLQLMDRLQTSAGIVTVASSAGRDWAENQTAVAGVLGTEDFKSGLLWLAQNPGDWRANAYKFSKQCAAAFTYPAAVKAKAHGTRINCINPGITETRCQQASDECSARRSMMTSFGKVPNRSARRHCWACGVFGRR